LIVLCFIALSKDFPQQSSSEYLTGPIPQIGIIKGLSDSALLDHVQKEAFRYFWQRAEPTSGKAMERINIDNVFPENDHNVVTSGGSGFGIMGLIVAINRGFIPEHKEYNGWEK
jgi:hypothetical protein